MDLVRGIENLTMQQDVPEFVGEYESGPRTAVRELGHGDNGGADSDPLKAPEIAFMDPNSQRARDL